METRVIFLNKKILSFLKPILKQLSDEPKVYIVFLLENKSKSYFCSLLLNERGNETIVSLQNDI